MTLEEFSNGFETLVNSYRRFKGFDDREILDSVEFDEYEKSLFLTKAQEELVLMLYSGKNPYGDSFEHTEELRRGLSNLVLETRLEPINNTSGYVLGADTNSKFFTLPDGVWFITYEAATVNGHACGDGVTVDAVPVTQDEYHKIRKNPFRGSNGRRALRLDLADNVIEVICKSTVVSYYVRYLKKPSPIILVDLPDGLSIENRAIKTPCTLHSSLHQKVLENAVMLGLRSKGLVPPQKESEK